MKILVLILTVILCLSIACKKDPGVQQLKFLVDSSDGTLTTKWDSIAYTTINYSDKNDLKTGEINNPDVYSHSVDIDLNTEYLTLKAGHTYLLKKFDMIGKSGKILYYIPFDLNPPTQSIPLKLPWSFIAGEGKVNYVLSVIRYP
jgi:hypothetical protein